MADVDIRVTSVIETYQRRLNSKPHFPSTTFGRATLCANSNGRTVTDGDVGRWYLLPHALLLRQSGTVHAFSTVFSTSWFCSSHTTSFAALLLILPNKNTFVQSPPAQGKIYDITYHIATNPLRRRRRPSHQTQGDIIAKEWLLFIQSCWQSCWYGIEMNCLILYFSNDRKHMAACESIPLSLQAPHLPSIAVMYLRNSPLCSLQYSRHPQLISLCRALHLGETEHSHSWCSARH
jgi:hypothetical protein